jgi:hypothetical protein
MITDWLLQPIRVARPGRGACLAGHCIADLCADRLWLTQFWTDASPPPRRLGTATGLELNALSWMKETFSFRGNCVRIFLPFRMRSQAVYRRTL